MCVVMAAAAAAAAVRGGSTSSSTELNGRSHRSENDWLGRSLSVVLYLYAIAALAAVALPGWGPERVH